MAEHYYYILGIVRGTAPVAPDSIGTSCWEFDLASTTGDRDSANHDGEIDVNFQNVSSSWI
jgi:hypothetical protein